MISRSHALAGLGYGSLAIALVGLTAIGAGAGTAVDVPGACALAVERDTAHVCAAATDAAVITVERDTVQLGAPTVEPMAVLTTEHDTAQLAPVETDAAVLTVERDTCTLTAEPMP